MRGLTLGVAAFAFFLALGGPGIGRGEVFHLGEPDPGYPLRRRVRLTLVLRNDTSRVVEQADLWARAPVRQTASQKCLRIETSHPCDLIVGDLGNQAIHFAFDHVPPFSSKVVAVHAVLAFSEAPHPTALGDPALFLSPDTLIEADHPDVLRLASELHGRPSPAEAVVAANSDRGRACPPEFGRAGWPQPGAIPDSAAGKTVRAIFDWVTHHIEDAGYLRDDRGALYALRFRSGDCTEYAYLFTALARAAGIPARVAAGYVYGESGVVRPEDFHNWAEAYVHGAWSVVDPQLGRCAVRQGDYVAFRVVGRRSSDPLKGAHRFRVEPKELAVSWE